MSILLLSPNSLLNLLQNSHTLLSSCSAVGSFLPFAERIFFFFAAAAPAAGAFLAFPSAEVTPGSYPGFLVYSLVGEKGFFFSPPWISVMTN